MRAHYSVIQFCPDRRRDERLNLGLVVLTDNGRSRSKVVNTDREQRRIMAAFGLNWEKMQAVLFAAKSIADSTAIQNIRTLDEYYGFAAATKANAIRLTTPRYCRIDDLDADFNKLFAELVEWKGE